LEWTMICSFPSCWCCSCSYMYAKNKWLYFLLNFCSWVNASCVVSVLYAPNSAWLWRLNYACNNGWSLAFKMEILN
jgi:hypothetical protein